MDSNKPKPDSADSPKISKKIAVIISLLTTIIIIQSIKIYVDYRKSNQQSEALTGSQEELKITMLRLSEIQSELDQSIAEVSRLGGDITEMEKAKVQIESELKSVRKRNRKNIIELQGRVKGYELLLRRKDLEIEQLKFINTELHTENKVLKTKQNRLSDSIVQLAENTDKLTSKIALASRLKAESISVVAFNTRDKKRTPPFRSKQIAKLAIDLTIAENKVAPIEGKKILIRVSDQNGQVIFDLARGSGTFMVDGKEEFYTAAQEILFDNTSQKVTFVYEKGSAYSSGTYTVEVFTDDYRMGGTQFTVK